MLSLFCAQDAFPLGKTDHQVAITLMQRAIDCGFKMGYLHLGHLYYEKDEPELAQEAFRHAHEAGDWYGSVEYAHMLNESQRDKAIEIYRAAIQCGLKEIEHQAYSYLSYLYFEGLGVEMDAYMAFDFACKSGGIADSQAVLKDPIKLLDIETFPIDAAFVLGCLFYLREGPAVNLEHTITENVAYKLLLMCAERQDAESVRVEFFLLVIFLISVLLRHRLPFKYLIQCYKLGKGCPVRMDRAVEWQARLVDADSVYDQRKLMNMAFKVYTRDRSQFSSDAEFQRCFYFLGLGFSNQLELSEMQAVPGSSESQTIGSIRYFGKSEDEWVQHDPRIRFNWLKEDEKARVFLNQCTTVYTLTNQLQTQGLYALHQVLYRYHVPRHIGVIIRSHARDHLDAQLARVFQDFEVSDEPIES